MNPGLPKVICSTLPRTGNQSLRRALQMLGYQRTEHDPRPLESIDHYDAVTEARFRIVDLIRRYPNAHYIMLVRDPETWLRSAEGVKNRGLVIPELWNPLWTCGDNWQQTIRDRIHLLHILVPSSRLLIYDIQEGWHPLCKFLGLAIDEATPFPNIDAYAEGGPRRE